jgi:hypothetical protein
VCCRAKYRRRRGPLTINPAVHPRRYRPNPTWLVMCGYETGRRLTYCRFLFHLTVLYAIYIFITTRPLVNMSCIHSTILQFQSSGARITLAYLILFLPLVIRLLSMASPSETKSSKKRIGRKRLPPLAPGPSIQFVVASHPDDFRDGATMRNVRSHVMYKHKDGRVSPPSEKRKSREGSKTPAVPTRTPSPMTFTSDGVLDNDNVLMTSSSKRKNTEWNEESYNYTSDSYTTSPVRTLAARIISATTAAPARSIPAMFEQPSEFPFIEHSALTQASLASLRQEHISNTAFFCHGTFQSHSSMFGS